MGNTLTLSGCLRCADSLQIQTSCSSVIMSIAESSLSKPYFSYSVTNSSFPKTSSSCVEITSAQTLLEYTDFTTSVNGDVTSRSGKPSSTHSIPFQSLRSWLAKSSVCTVVY